MADGSVSTDGCHLCGDGCTRPCQAAEGHTPASPVTVPVAYRLNCTDDRRSRMEPSSRHWRSLSITRSPVQLDPFAASNETGQRISSTGELELRHTLDRATLIALLLITHLSWLADTHPFRLSCLTPMLRKTRYLSRLTARRSCRGWSSTSSTRFPVSIPLRFPSTHRSASLRLGRSWSQMSPGVVLLA